MSEYNGHLTLEERRIIRTGIENGSTKTAIANTIGKDNSTVGKEIKNHRYLKKKCSASVECGTTRCVYKKACSIECPGYIPFYCKRRDRSPGACNGCKKIAYCKADIYEYNPEIAHEQYRETLSDARSGVDLTTSEAKVIGDTVKPLLKLGHSPYQIIQTHPELGICEKTVNTSWVEPIRTIGYIWKKILMSLLQKWIQFTMMSPMDLSFKPLSLFQLLL